MDIPTTKVELLGRIHRDHAKLEAVLTQLTNEQMTEGGLEGGWSVKDVLAHLTWWEQRMLRGLQSALQGESPQPLANEGEDLERTLNRINAETYAANFERPLEEVRTEKRRSFEQIIALLESFTDDEVANPIALEQVLGRPFQQFIASDTYDHYTEHTKAIQHWLDTRSDNTTQQQDS